MRKGRQLDHLADRIRALPGPGRLAVAVVSAQRLMKHHLSLAAPDRDPYIEALAPDLDMLWIALSAPTSKADAGVRKQLKRRNSEPYADQIGKNGWPRGDDHPFAAVTYALNAYCLRDAKFAVGGAMRLVDAASDMAGSVSERLGEDLMSHKAKLRRRSAARPEINRVISAVAILERESVTPASLEKLRKMFADGGLGEFRTSRSKSHR